MAAIPIQGNGPTPMTITDAGTLTSFSTLAKTQVNDLWIENLGSSNVFIALNVNTATPTALGPLIATKYKRFNNGQ